MTEPAAQLEPGTPEMPITPIAFEAADAPDIIVARDALRRHAWREAFDLYTAADQAGELAGPDLEALADSAWFTGQADVSIATKERAYKAHLAAAGRTRAAYLALDLAREYSFKRKPSIASAWFHRGERLLAGEPETYANGYLALARSGSAREGGDIDGAVALAAEAVQIGVRTGNVDLQALALTGLGGLKIATGATAEGFALMEEAAVAAVNDELSPFLTGVTYCNVISACRDLTDYQRASEWTEATERWCERQSVNGFPGICRVHRAEVVAIGGALVRAEEELRHATVELAAYNATPPQADGFYALGEVRLRMGDLAGAEDALRKAHALGRSPQPALALIRLAEGKTREAAAAVNAAASEDTQEVWARTRLLPAQVQIAVAAGDLARARAAAEEFGRLVAASEAPALRAGRHETLGRVLLAEGNHAEATRELRSAIRDWQEVGAPYEVARGRALLAAALRAAHDDDAADLELGAARDEFRRLGARLDAEAAEIEVQSVAERRAGPVQVRKTFLFTDIVGSTNLAEALGNEAWERLLRWHDDTLRTLFSRNGGEVVNSTGDGFFVAFEAPRPAIDAAIAIQRALAEQGRTTGFAPAVRIGVHVADANRRGSDYSGVGVHVAARVAALAGGGEIVATRTTAAEAGDIAALDARAATLKGVATPVEVVTVDWA